MAAALTGIAGCGKQGSTPTALNMETDAQLFKLAQMNGCIECHAVSATSVGPSWLAIAERYQAAPRAEAKALLVESVEKGSKGQWLTWKGGGGMPPLGRRVAKEHIEQLVEYIVSLKRAPGAG